MQTNKIVTHRSYFYRLLIAFLIGSSGQFACQPDFQIRHARLVERLPQIDPDYCNTVIPPNIAPLNFLIEEPGRRFVVKIFSKVGDTLTVSSARPQIRINLVRWQKLLGENPGNRLYFNIFVEDSAQQWQRFKTISNQIAREKIDHYLAYRLLFPGYIKWKEIGIYQRNLENFNEQKILHNRTLDNGCINCHTFLNHSSRMLLHLRGGPGTGMLMTENSKAVKINTKTEFNGHTAYACWHPDGKIVAFAVIKVRQFFHAVGENREVFDTASDLVLYRIDTNEITTTPKIASPHQMETFPTWSPDGKYLYFCRAPALNPDLHFSKQYKNIRYDLMRLRYDAGTDTWGELETVLSSAETGLSSAHPRISPDGRYLLFTMSQYGNFTIFHQDSDLYLMDLKNSSYRRLSINSDRCESYHSWSSNSRWFVFSSKRRDGLHARPYFSYVDSVGTVHKPCLLPQEDPTFYNRLLKTYNLPEFVKERVEVSPRAFTKTAFALDQVKNARLVPKMKLKKKVDKETFPWLPAPHQ